jgi:hypothetical protein
LLTARQLPRVHFSRRGFRGLSGYTAIALQSATGQWGGTAGEQFTSMWSPTAIWQAYAPGSSAYIAAQGELQSICGSGSTPPSGMTSVGINNQCNPPIAPSPGETGEAYQQAQFAYTAATSVAPAQQQTYLQAATTQAAVSAATSPAPGTTPAPVPAAILQQVAQTNPWPNVTSTPTGASQPVQQNVNSANAGLTPAMTSNDNTSATTTTNVEGIDWTSILLWGGAAVVGIVIIGSISK